MEAASTILCTTLRGTCVFIPIDRSLPCGKATRWSVPAPIPRSPNSVKLFPNRHATSLRQGERTRLRRPYESFSKRRVLRSPANVHFDPPKWTERAWPGRNGLRTGPGEHGSMRHPGRPEGSGESGSGIANAEDLVPCAARCRLATRDSWSHSISSSAFRRTSRTPVSRNANIRSFTRASYLSPTGTGCSGRGERYSFSQSASAQGRDAHHPG